jgi:hypothetical protein
VGDGGVPRLAPRGVQRIVRPVVRMSARTFVRTFLLWAAVLTCAVQPAAAEPPAAPAPTASKMRSTVDGWLDLSGFLDEAYGFVPLVVPITEPAVGYGALAGLMFVDKPKVESKAAGFGRPNLSFLGVLGTENGTRGALAGDLRHWLGDRVTSLAGVVDASVNLDYYVSSGGDPARADTPLRYNIDVRGGGLQGRYRLGDTPGWVGLGYVSATARVAFDAPAGASRLPDFASDVRFGALVPSLTYDSRDNFFTPTRGSYLDATVGVFDDALGSSQDFRRGTLSAIHYRPLNRALTGGVRAGAGFGAGELPFYLRPFVTLRGVQALRYAGERVAEAEAELRWQARQRFSVVAFGGAGAAWHSLERGNDKVTVKAGGVGLRYELAERYGLHMGLDVAHGPDGPIVYVQFGNAWLRP